MEPNSPIPLLLDRALRVAPMNFLELLENMVPEALTHGKDILGSGAAGMPAVLRSGGAHRHPRRPRQYPCLRLRIFPG
jgi:hypothetical protein